MPQVVNQHLLSDLTRAGLWTRDLKNELVAANGSVQVRCRTSLMRLDWTHTIRLANQCVASELLACIDGMCSCWHSHQPDVPSRCLCQMLSAHSAAPGHPGRDEGAVQDSVGNQAEGAVGCSLL